MHVPNKDFNHSMSSYINRCISARCVAHLGNTWHQDALWEEGSAMLWVMLCWGTSGPAIHVDVTLTRTTYLSSVADHEHPLMETP